MNRIIAFVAIASIAFVIGCQRDTKDVIADKQKADAYNQIGAKGGQQQVNAPCNPNAYVVTLESVTEVNGNFEWVWSVRNPNPGNGTNGTVQDLSHWGMQFGSCVVWEHVIAAATSRNGTTWTSFTPTYQSDPSQNCLTTPVLKFDVGTSGSAKTYYRITLSEDYDVAPAAFGYYKSGNRTGCCTFTFQGIGCPDDDEEPGDFCAMHIPHWFDPFINNPWCQNVVFGANSYNSTQGQAIYTTSNPNGVALYAFTAASALQLSAVCTNNNAPIPAEISAAYNVLVQFLSNVSYNDLLNVYFDPGVFSAVNTAAGQVNDWIANHECECVCGCGCGADDGHEEFSRRR